jgi:O-methyltransferase
MIGLMRLDDLQACVESVVEDAIEGDLIEAGVWRGGASILVRATLDSLGAHGRTLWLADSFEGFPAPRDGDVAADRVVDQDLI